MADDYSSLDVDIADQLFSSFFGLCTCRLTYYTKELCREVQCALASQSASKSIKQVQYIHAHVVQQIIDQQIKQSSKSSKCGDLLVGGRERNHNKDIALSVSLFIQYSLPARTPFFSLSNTLD